MRTLSDYPRFQLATLPTPLEPMSALSAALRRDGATVPRLWIKRDDATGLAFGGNKARKLEFLLGEAIALGADCVITYGAAQSNHVRQTAAAAVRAGLPCHVLFEDQVRHDDDYTHSGNVLLDRLLGARIERYAPPGADMLLEAQALEADLLASGAKPYLIVSGGSSPTGALGYAAAASELLDQVAADVVIHATGSMGTQAGLLAGFAAVGSDTQVIGVSVRRPAEEMAPEVADLSRETAARLDLEADFAALAHIDDRWVGEGYGIPTDAMLSGLLLLARTEGILLDPVYSGKAFAGLIGMIEEGRFEAGQDVVFVHTGGTPALFAYRSAFAEAELAAASS